MNRYFSDARIGGFTFIHHPFVHKQTIYELNGNLFASTYIFVFTNCILFRNEFDCFMEFGVIDDVIDGVIDAKKKIIHEYIDNLYKHESR